LRLMLYANAAMREACNAATEIVRAQPQDP
jgi:hypothetical protein